MQTLSPSLRRELSKAAKTVQRMSVPSASKRPSFKNAKRIFLIRSATPELFRKCIREMRQLAPKAVLHIVSHERDRALVHTLLVKKDKFYPYTAGGNYSLESMSELLAELKEENIDTFVMLANNVYGYPHIAEILCALGAKRINLFNVNERWYSVSREELEFKNACAKVYLSICSLIHSAQ